MTDIIDTLQSQRVEYYTIYFTGAMVLFAGMYLAATLQTTAGSVGFFICFVWWVVAHIRTDTHKTPLPITLSN